MMVQTFLGPPRSADFQGYISFTFWSTLSCIKRLVQGLSIFFWQSIMVVSYWAKKPTRIFLILDSIPAFIFLSYIDEFLSLFIKTNDITGVFKGRKKSLTKILHYLRIKFKAQRIMILPKTASILL